MGIYLNLNNDGFKKVFIPNDEIKAEFAVAVEG